MPKTPMDYSKCIMYKIVCNDLSVTDCYVGHTTNFKQRKNKHRINCNCSGSDHYHLKVYQTIRANGGWENWSMIEIEKYNSKDIYEAVARERYWYEQLKATLNMLRPSISQKEKIYNNNKSSKDFYEANKEVILSKNKEKYTCVCGSICRLVGKSRHYKSKKHQDYLASQNSLVV